MNPSHSRLKRVPPKRGGPIRNSMNSETHNAGRPETISGALRGALECGVQTAYAVIDEYMQRGFNAARNNQKSGNGRLHMSNERSNYGNYGQNAGSWGPMTPLMEQWMAAFRLWTDAWAPLMGGRPGAWPSPFPAPGYGPTNYPAAAPPPICVEVSSSRRTEVIVQLKPGADLAQPSADSFVPPLLKNVTVDRRHGRLHVLVTIADKQPAGRYNGVIRAADGCVVGDLTVVISDGPHPA